MDLPKFVDWQLSFVQRELQRKDQQPMVELELKAMLVAVVLELAVQN